jgi:hypothetical protein
MPGILAWVKTNQPLTKNGRSHLSCQVIRAFMMVMINTLPRICFYLPQTDYPRNGIPATVDDHWQVFGQGIYNWTLQTYLRLKEAGFPCDLVDQFPSTGIVLAHRDSLPENLRPSAASLMVVCIKAERDPHPIARLHIIQNPQEVSLSPYWLKQSLRHSYYIPHWVQPGLIPRDPARGDRFETVAFFGNARNLAPELQTPEWREQLNSLGLRWYEVERDRWNDYSQIDVVLAIRSLDRLPHFTKPATKLWTAWQAGIPAIVGTESALQAERRSELDFLQVTSLEDLLLALRRLRDDVQLRHDMVQNGLTRAQEHNVELMTARWTQFLTEVAVPAYYQWSQTPVWQRQLFFLQQNTALKIQRLLNRVNPQN